MYVHACYCIEVFLWARHACVMVLFVYRSFYMEICDQFYVTTQETSRFKSGAVLCYDI